MADIPDTLRSWSATAGSNSPTGGTSIGTGLDDNLRAIQAAIRGYLAGAPVNMASASTVDLSTATSNYVNITGTTTITALGTESSGIQVLLKFAGALTLTHNATSLILPGGANIVTQAGDVGLFVSEGSGNWRCVYFNNPFLQSGSGATARTWTAKARDILSVKDFGAVGDGSTDDTTAIQAALTAVAQYGSVYFPVGTYIVGSTLTLSTNNVTVFGRGKLKAKDSTSFAYILDASSRTGVIIDGLEFDANKSGRAAAQAVAFSTISVSGGTDCVLQNLTIRNSLGYGGSSAVAINASGGNTRLRVSGVRFLDCGTSATTLPSDGIFMRGDYCVIENCYAENVTDTAFVMEGCNHSLISNCTAENCTAIAGITNDTASDCVGNSIIGVTGSCNYVGSTGGIVAVGCFSTGNLRESTIANVSIRLDASATNIGPGVQVRTTSTGRVIGLKMDGVSVDTGTTSTKMGQGFVISDSDDVQINNCYVRMDASAGSAAIRFDGACVNGIVTGGYITGADYGLYVLNTSEVILQDAVLKSNGTYGILTANTATLIEQNNRISGFGTSAMSVGGSTTVRSQTWQSWTPTYSTDLGNSAFSFTVTPTTTLARISRTGNTVSVTVNYAAVLNAITPQQVRVSLPTGCVPANLNTWSPASILNATTYETGLVRPSNSGDLLIFYRANLVNYSSGANVEGRVSLTFEATNP